MKKALRQAFVLCMVFLTCVNFTACNSEEEEMLTDTIITIGNDGSVTKGHTFVAVDEATFYLDNVKYSRVNSSLRIIGYDNQLSGKVVIPATIQYKGTSLNVTDIVYDAFMGCKSLTSIAIANSVKSIGIYSFKECTNLASVTFGSGVNNIGERAFYGCNSLSSIIIPNGVTNIGTETFYRCTNLKSVTFPNNITSIGKGAFSGCAITDLVIPNSVTSIGENAFSGCNFTTVTIPKDLTNIEVASAFASCKQLVSIEVDANNPIYSSHEGALFNKTKTRVIFCPQGKSNSYIIPNGVTSIGVSAFSDCANLTSVTIPNTVLSIEDSAFLYCKNLTSVTIPNSVTSIGERSFSDCSSLSYLTIGSGVQRIGFYAFQYSDAIKSITNLADTPQKITSNTFYWSGAITLHVKKGLGAIYRNTDLWNRFNIIEDAEEI